MPGIMAGEHPSLNDFGITQEEYRLYAKKQLDESTDRQVRRITFVVVLGALWLFWVLFSGWNADEFIFMTIGAVVLAWLSTACVAEKVAEHKREQLLASDTAQRIERYEEAVRAYREARHREEQEFKEQERLVREEERVRLEHLRSLSRTNKEYWMRLTGVEFEQEVARMFRSQGYLVAGTPVSGDKGIDLILYKDERYTVVQCKRYKAPVGPAIARELLGSKAAKRASYAILACTGGFTRSTVEYAQANDIELLSMPDFIRWARESEKE